MRRTQPIKISPNSFNILPLDTTTTTTLYYCSVLLGRELHLSSNSASHCFRQFEYVSEAICICKSLIKRYSSINALYLCLSFKAQSDLTNKLSVLTLQILILVILKSINKIKMVLSYACTMYIT